MAPVRASLGWGVPALLVFTSTAVVSSEPSLRILHDPIACVTPSAFSVVRARVEPETGVDRVSILLKDESEVEFSQIDLTPTAEGWAAVLPLPSEGSPEILYYLEAAGGSLHATTPLNRARVEPVASKCMTETSQEPPPKKKKRRGAFIALGAAGAAALGVGILSGEDAQGSSPGAPEPTPPPPVIPPVGPPIPPPQEPVTACFDLPRTGEVGVPVRMDASCSNPRGSIGYEWSLGDGREKEGRVVTPSYSAPGLYVVELRAVRLTGVTSSFDEDHLEKTILIVEGTAPSGGGSTDLTIDKAGSLTSRIVDGVLHFHISYTLTVQNHGRHTASRVTVRDNLMSDLTLSSVTTSLGTCDAIGRDVTCALEDLPPGAAATVRLEVDVRPGVPENTTIENTATVESPTRDPAPASNQDTETTLLVRPPTLASTGSLESSFVSTIETSARDGSTSGTVRVNGVSLDSVNDGTSYRHRVRTESETVVVEGSLQSAAQGIWRFDMSAEARVTPGSIEALEGQVLGREPLGIVFRLTGQPGERVRFTFRLRR